MPVGEGFVVREHEGKSYRFRKLSQYDRREILAREKSRRRASLLQSLRDAGADKGEMVYELREFDKQQFGDDEYLDLLFGTAGQCDIFEHATSDITLGRPGQPEWKQRGDASEALGYVGTLKMGEQLALAAELSNVELKAASSQDGAGEGEPDTYDPPGESNPTQPAATSTPATMTTTT